MAKRPPKSTLSVRRRVAKAEPKFSANRSPLTINAHLRVIGEKSHEQLRRLAEDRAVRKTHYDTSSLFDVCLAFQAIGISVPHALFAKQRDRRRPGELNRLLSLPESERTEAVHEYLSRRPQYIVAEESDSDWEWCRLYPEREPNLVGFAQVDHHFRHLNWVGQLSQWNYLISLASAEASLMLLENGPLSGLIPALGVAEQENLILAITNRGPIYAIQCLGTSSATAERHLTRAGFAVVAWANATDRLLTLYDALLPEQRLQLPATTRLLAASKPVLDWTDADRELIDQVRRELFAVSGWWDKRSAQRKQSKPTITARIALNEIQVRILQRLSTLAYSRNLKQLSKDLGVNYHKLRNNVLSLAKIRPQLIKRDGTQKDGWTLTDDGVIHVTSQPRENVP